MKIRLATRPDNKVTVEIYDPDSKDFYPVVTMKGLPEKPENYDVNYELDDNEYSPLFFLSEGEAIIKMKEYKAWREFYHGNNRKEVEI